MPLSVLIARNSHEENTFAEVTFMPRGDVIDSASLKQALVRALTTWVRTTDAGRDAWKHNNGDFNIGDLASEDYSSVSALGECLRAENVDLVDIKTYTSDETAWEFDDVLVTE